MNKNNKGLGRGIEALFAENELDNNDEAVSNLNLDSLVPNPYQPRKKFDKKALDDLTDSIKQSGVFQPIIVRKPEDDNDNYQILAGERRFKASKVAGKDTIPAIVREVSDEQMMEIAVMENLQREDLSPLEEAEAYNTLMMKLDLTQAEVSKRLGKSRPYIANYLRLLGLPQQIKEMLDKKQLSMGQARALLAIRNRQKLIEYAKKAVNESLTVRHLEKMITEYSNQEKSKKATKTSKSPFIKNGETKLQDWFGTKVVINENRSNKGKGKIEIEYLSNEDLNRIFSLLDIDLND
ncbi:ParB/RepB/Spo0J family partition protein [Lactobacillus sp. S2-2]|uniref:ParB/RepB/Spo0J family partition protein n=1 Tax=Lactobacillus sp. S2-2 TaxID=2692917 RepID=UPI001EFFA56B|nr:ParB/RepB/Spo0J family partition protein [Lactobacillus sp. S2-2]MCF6515209.1 ParB/RepB/Spo0J family partition protein [Lactobacillus sp. S2-2]